MSALMAIGLLALAAYNSGGGNVRNAIKKNLKTINPQTFGRSIYPKKHEIMCLN